MAQVPSLVQFLIVVLAGWLARRQEAFIEYVMAENRMLKARLGRRRLIFSDTERRLLARPAKAIGRRKLFELDPIVSPDTLLRWHRPLIAMKWTFARRRTGRPRMMMVIEELIVRMASENPRWGYTRIRGALANLGHKVARGTVANVLKREGIEPAPTRGTRTAWSVFLKAHWRALVAAAQSYPRRPRAESARFVATAGRASRLAQSRCPNLQVPQQHRRAGPPGDQAKVRGDGGLQIIRQCVDRAFRNRAGSSDWQASVLVRSRRASSSVDEGDVGDDVAI